MKLISTLYLTDQMDVCMMIQNRNSRQGKSKEDVDGPLISKYVSKVGNESLIFNPSVAVTINSRIDKGLNAYVPLSLFYRFTGNLTKVYESIGSSGLYHSEGNAIYVDRNKANEFSRRIPLFRNTLSIIPDVHVDKSNGFSKGISLVVDGKTIGTLNHQEALGLIEQLDHLDITGYTLMAGVIDELESANNRLDAIMVMLQKILGIIQEKKLPPVVTAEQLPLPMNDFDWKPAIDWSIQ